MPPSSSSNKAAYEKRDLWTKPRERKRLQARYQIRQRVQDGNVVVVGDSNEDSSISSTDHTLLQQQQDEQNLSKLLHNLEAGLKCFFSTRILDQHYDLLNQLVPIHMLSRYRIQTLCTSRFGYQYTECLLQYIQSLSCCSFMEYAVWLGEYTILVSFLTGGLDPTLCCSSSGNENSKQSEQRRRLDISSRLLRRFFDRFPTSLSGYMVKRVVEMRMQYWKDQQNEQQQHCWICNNHHTLSNLLSFGTPCHHVTCENCMWESLLTNIDDREEGDVVQCPVCHAAIHNDSCDATTDSLGDTPIQRKEISLQKYNLLPSTTTELKKNSPGRKKKISKQDTLCYSWPQAVARCLGSSRDVRRDKLFAYTEHGSLHHVKGCCVEGVDVDAINEYGQTALYMAAWRGNVRIVEILLEFGADVSIVAHGGSTALRVAQANGHDEVVALLEQAGTMRQDDSSDDGGERSYYVYSAHEQHTPSNMITLIDAGSDHPGAGSFFIDDAVSSAAADALVSLWQTIPVETLESRKKNQPELCSVRSYFCDAEGHVGQMLVRAIKSIVPDVDEVGVYDNMRFLHYSQPGTVLAPHVDLSRTSSLSGRRSTHTFILYLEDCESGGETLLLAGLTGDEKKKVLASVSPRRGRLLLFPHVCPHSGNKVVDVPKLLLRGEVFLSRCA